MPLPVRCLTCKNKTTNCICYEFRFEEVGELVHLFVDNCCTDLVRNEHTGTWKVKRGSKEYTRPVYVDGVGPILTLSAQYHELRQQIEREIREETFFVGKYVDFNYPHPKKFDKDMVRRFRFLRKPIKKVQVLEHA